MPRRSSLRWGLSDVTHHQQPWPQSVDRVNIMIRNAARIHIDNRSYHGCSHRLLSSDSAWRRWRRGNDTSRPWD
eukprot:162983-Chlamydomonas_euryale.AAC.2